MYSYHFDHKSIRFKAFQDIIVKSEIFSFIHQNEIEFYIAQISLTFITISVMSIFSDTNEVVYWKNIVKRLLIDPPARCFRAYFGYSFFSLLGATFCLLFKFNFVLIVFFFNNVISLFNLTRIMISCYYGRDSKKKKIEKEMIKKLEELYTLKLLSNSRKNGNDDLVNKEKQKYDEKYDEIKKSFIDFRFYTNKAFINGEYKIVCENIEEYGIILSHINAVFGDLLFNSEDDYKNWYNATTENSFYQFVKNYCKETNNRIVGKITSQATNTLQKSPLMLYDVLEILCLNSKTEDKNIYRIISYPFLVKINAIRREMDLDIWSYNRIEEYINYGISCDLLSVFFKAYEIYKSAEISNETINEKESKNDRNINDKTEVDTIEYFEKRMKEIHEMTKKQDPFSTLKRETARFISLVLIMPKDDISIFYNLFKRLSFNEILEYYKEDKLLENIKFELIHICERNNIDEKTKDRIQERFRQFYNYCIMHLQKQDKVQELNKKKYDEILETFKNNYLNW